MIDQSHLDTFLVFETKDNVFHADLSALGFDDFPVEIPTLLGNETPFIFYKEQYHKHDQMHIATYKQKDSKAVLLLYTE